jgi:hypothetical protein
MELLKSRLARVTGQVTYPYSANILPTVCLMIARVRGRTGVPFNVLETGAWLSFDSLIKHPMSRIEGNGVRSSTGTGVSSASFSQQTRPLSQDEIVQRQELADFLDTASEDEFTEKVFVPLFQRLGFHRVSPTGHAEKALEFGKDLWMKYQLPTSHWIYFCAQIKKDKIDSSGAGGNNNVATVLNQARMAIDHPIFDPEANRKVLLDHLFLISAGEITKAARAWLVEQLDAGQRRHIIFMDRDEFLDQSARILLDLRLDSPPAIADDDIPF